MQRIENKKENKQLPIINHLFSSVRSFKQLKRLSKFDQAALSTSTLPNNTFNFKLAEESNRKKIQTLLKANRQQLKQINNYELQKMNLTFVKLVKILENPAMKCRQQKMKKQHMEKNIQQSNPYSSLVLEEKEPIQNVINTLNIAVEKIQFYNYQSFYSFREGSCLGICDKNLFLHGGYTAQYDNHKSFLHRFDYSKKTWIQPVQKGDIPSVTKIGQTVDQWKGHLVYTGGMALNLMGKKRTFCNEIMMYNPQKQEWSKNKSIEGRRYHASIRYLNTLLLTGGINEKESYITFIQSISLTNHSVHSYNLPDDENGIAYHKMVSTLEMESKRRNMYLEDGIYCFGGKNNNGDLIEGMRVLKCEINQNNQLIPKKWVKPKTEGLPPKPRINHSMSFIQKISSIIIIGGQDQNHQPFNDIHILNLHSLQWYRPDIVFDQFLVKGISGHTSCVLGSKIIIFGGMNGNGMYNTELAEIETDQNKIHINTFYKSKRNIRRSGAQKTTFARSVKILE